MGGKDPDDPYLWPSAPPEPRTVEPHDLQLIVAALQQELYLDPDGRRWDRDREVNGANLVDRCVDLLDGHDLAPAPPPPAAFDAAPPPLARRSGRYVMRHPTRGYAVPPEDPSPPHAESSGGRLKAMPAAVARDRNSRRAMSSGMPG